MLKRVLYWGKKAKDKITKQSMLQFRNRKGDLFSWENEDLSDLVVDRSKLEQKLTDRDLVPEIPGIRLESDYEDFEREHSAGVEPQ